MTKNRIRSKTRDAAFQFRMGAGFAGDVNRTHPASIDASMNDATNPVALFGLACLVNTAANTIRSIAAGDTGTTAPYGATVRPFPYQQAASTNYGAAAFGAGSIGPNAIVDTLRSGYILVQLPAGQTTTKGAAVFVWCAVSAGAHVQGGFESAATGGSTATLDANRFSFNGPPDASGIAELAFNI